MWHPTSTQRRQVCISILHPPGVDELNSQESAEERWRPILEWSRSYTVLPCCLDPNDESPANLDAAVMWRNDKPCKKRRRDKSSERARKNAKVLANTGSEPWRKTHQNSNKVGRITHVNSF
jgi:ubiquitin-protein ligase